MDPDEPKPIITCHVGAIPFPGRGHVNPMFNFCKLLAAKRPDFLITFIVTEEWLGLLGSEPKPPANVKYATIPNVLPSELVRGADHPGFVKAVMTKMGGPVEQLLERLDEPMSVIVYDAFVNWVKEMGSRRNIAVAAFWPMSATMFSLFSHYHLLLRRGHLPVKNLAEQGDDRISCIPGVPSIRILDLPTPFHGQGHEVLHIVLEGISLAQKAEYLLFTSIYDLENRVIDALKIEIPNPIYTIGPAIPYFNTEQGASPTDNQNDVPDYIKWLDNQPKDSVLYISQGSFLSVTTEQMQEIVVGVHESGVRYLWVTRFDAARFSCSGGDKGIVVPWCDQLRVLCHPSIGGFWSHCGWNSTKEGAFAGLPMLTLPIMWDQIPNSKMIVEDWKIGFRVNGRLGIQSLVTRDAVAGLVQRLMDTDSEEGKEMRARATQLKEISRQATAKGGSSEQDIDAFIRDISESHPH